jgi:ferredoxin
MRLRVDADRCTGHGRCYRFGGVDWLEPDDEGYVTLRGSEIDVPEDDETGARSAADACPEEAIFLSD